MWFGRGSDVVRTWFGRGSDVVQMWFGHVFGSGADSLAEVKGKWFAAFPRAKLRRQFFYDGAKFWAKGRAFELGEILDEHFWVFSCFMCCAERPTKFSPQIPPNLSITPCLVTAPATEISEFRLRELVGLGAPNDFSYDFYTLFPTDLEAILVAISLALRSEIELAERFRSAIWASIRKAPDTFNFLRHVMRAIWSV